MILQTLRVGPLSVNCYIVGDEATRHVIVIDPGGDVRMIADTVRQMAARVDAIVLTHAHFDHVMGVAGLKGDTGAPVFVGAKEVQILMGSEGQAKLFGLAMPSPPQPDRLLKEGDKLMAGGIELSVLETPGHTPGGICLWQEQSKAVFTGDTLMRAGIGRTDFPGGSLPEILSSIRTKLLVLPPETRVYPGHGPVTTIAEEKRFNPFLQNYV